ncbi:MAG: entericidin A/B family lipoprotein [Elstera sp.]
MTQTKPMKTLVLLAFLASTALLSACNTMAGAGQDITKGGQALEKSADKHAP